MVNINQGIAPHLITDDAAQDFHRGIEAWRSRRELSKYELRIWHVNYPKSYTVVPAGKTRSERRIARALANLWMPRVDAQIYVPKALAYVSAMEKQIERGNAPFSVRMGDTTVSLVKVVD